MGFGLKITSAQQKNVKQQRRGENATCWACFNKIVTFHSSTISEGGFVVGFDGHSERRNLNNRGKKHIGQGHKGNAWNMVKIKG
jgi:hypothetical protein